MSSLNYFSVYAEVNDVLFKQINDLKNRIYDKAKHEKSLRITLFANVLFAKRFGSKCLDVMVLQGVENARQEVTKR